MVEVQPDGNSDTERVAHTGLYSQALAGDLTPLRALNSVVAMLADLELTQQQDDDKYRTEDHATEMYRRQYLAGLHDAYLIVDAARSEVADGMQERLRRGW